MFGKGVRLFSLCGFEVRIDWSWLFIALLLSWSLARGVFPAFYPELSNTIYWLMGIIGALGLFGSIVLHELGHSLIARRFGIPMKGITLFIFGGVAEMGAAPPNAKSEFWMAIAGPIVSLLLGVVFLLLYRLGIAVDWPVPLIGVLGYLGWINLILLVFNLIPAFPLDGGRVLRSALWASKKNLRWATRIASMIGSTFAFILIGWGIVRFLFGDFIGGIWYVFLGWFLHQAAQASYTQVLMRETLAGEPVRRFMNEAPITVSPDTSIQDLVDNYFYKHPHKVYPLVEQDSLVGCVNIDDVKRIPKSEWATHSARELATPCNPESTIRPDVEAADALSNMSRAHVNRLMVVDHGHLLGIVALKDLMLFFSRKLELERA